ncbi:MAG TPA: methylmalonyl-CoA epimerase [Candidatus Krumholzibacteria bacterium]|nr:methylmalonyl-CoA epimerase [Candidatus Krumholzibacteria bacterium]
MIQGIDHVAIAVADIDAAVQTFETVFGMRVTHREAVGEFKVMTVTMSTGGTDIELVQATSPDSPIAKFVAERGAGLHHIALKVPDIDTALSMLREQGVPLVDQTARPGKNGSRVAFIHPKATNRVLCELVENRR